MTAWPPPPQSYPPTTYPGYPQPPRTGPSTGVLVLGAIGCFIAGAIASFALLVVVGLLIGEDTGGHDPSEAEALTYGPNGDLETFVLAPGQCGPAYLDELSSMPEGTNVDCNTEHVIEAYARVEPPALAGDQGAPFRDHDLASFADEACYTEFFPYVDSEYEDSDFDYVAVMPSRQAWTEGARTITCVLFHYDGETLTETARASNS